MMKRRHLFIGIDETDNGGKKGTDVFSICLGHQLEKEGLGHIAGISRHQLFTGKALTYSNGNGAACIELITCNETSEILSSVRQFIKANAHRGSETGFCLSENQEVPRMVIDWGLKARKKTVDLSEACFVAAECNLHLEGITKNARGMIGALAAVGLRATGDDGSMIWVKGHEINQLKGIFHAGEIYCSTRVDCIQTCDGFRIPVNATIEWQPQSRPVIRENHVTLLVEEHPEKEKCDWRVVGCE